MDEYVIHARLKNNLILSRILDKYKTVNNFCTEFGLAPTTVGLLVNLKKSAINKDNNWNKTAIDVANALGVLPEELFSEEQRTVELKTNEAYIELSREKLLSLANPFEAIDNKLLIAKMLETAPLTDNEREVLSLRFDEDKNLPTIAEIMNLSTERIRQIEANALRKLRTTKAAKDMYESR